MYHQKVIQVLFSACLVISLYIAAVVSEDASECTTYSATLTSVPDLTHNIVYQARRHHDFVIDDVKSTNYKRSFYWCQLDVKESDSVFKRYRHFGFNTTHWWVEKGCGGWFIVTECRQGAKVDVQQIVKLPDANGTPSATSLEDSALVDEAAVNRAESSPVDALYEKWPKLGYHFPTSDLMWDILDKATWIDVPDQLGFYKKYRKPRSVAFD